MKRIKLFLLPVLALLLCFAVCSCGAGSAEADQMEAGNTKYDYESPYDYGLTTDVYNESANGKTEDAVKDISTYTEKIIRNATVSAETRDFDRALAEIRASAASLGGYEQSVNTTGKSYHSSDRYCRSARLTLRIPADSLDAFLGTVGDLVNVTSQSANSINVTSEYYDIQSRIGVLQSEKVAYEEMLKKSDDVNYLLQIKDRLYDVIEEIEAYETQLRVYDNKVAYSTVSMTLDEVIEYSQITTPADSFGTRITTAFRESWKDFASGFQSFVVWFVSAIPTLLVIAVITGGAIGILLAVRARSRTKDASKSDKKE